LLALDTYVAYLERAKRGPDREAALHEVDGVYNHLVNFTMSRPHFWDEYLSHSDVVRRLRAVGRAVRAGSKR
jgi:hypothetical protein